MRRMNVGDAASLMSVYTSREDENKEPPGPGPDTQKEIRRKGAKALVQKTTKRAKVRPVPSAKAVGSRLTFFLPFDVIDRLTREKMRRRREAGRFRGAGADYSTLVTEAVRKAYS